MYIYSDTVFTIHAYTGLVLRLTAGGCCFFLGALDRVNYAVKFYIFFRVN
jgi:hypothetical protein